MQRYKGTRREERKCKKRKKEDCLSQGEEKKTKIGVLN
jgi:hypothetical protein